MAFYSSYYNDVRNHEPWTMNLKVIVMSFQCITLTFPSVKMLKWTHDIVFTGTTDWLPYVPLITFFAVCLSVPCDCGSKWWVHTCNVTAYRNTVSWQCGRDSWPRNVSKVGYAVTLRACSVCCRYLAVASKGWYGYGLSRSERATDVARSDLLRP